MNTIEARRRLLGRNVYKRTTEGNPAIAQGSLARRYPGITMQGWTEQDSTTGANLFDKSTAIKNKYINDSTGEMYDKAEGDTSASDYVLVRGLSYIRVTATTFAQWMAFYDINKDFISGINGYGEPIQVPQNAEYARFTIPNPVVDTFMVNAGSELLPWEPYTGRKPSPSPEYPQEIVSAGEYDEETQKWEYEVKLTGKNLFDPAKLTGGEIVEYNGIQCYKYLDNYTNFTYKDKFLENTQYCFNVICLSSEGNEEKSTDIIIWYTDGTTNRRQVSHNQLANIVSSANKTVDKITGNYNYSVTRYIDLSITTLGIGTEPVQYEPYKEQTVTLTADRPLTKWDKLEKRNGQWGWVYKSAEIESYTDESVPGEYYSTTGQLSVGAQVWYETTTETFAPLSESEQEAMNALYTFRPTTVLSNDCGCNMTLIYKTKKSLEVTD